MELWDSSIQLMLIGMGTVFVFLTLLVFLTSLMSAIIQKLSSDSSVVDNQSAAVVAAAAFMHHVKSKKSQSN